MVGPPPLHTLFILGWYHRFKMTGFATGCNHCSLTINALILISIQIKVRDMFFVQALPYGIKSLALTKELLIFFCSK